MIETILAFGWLFWALALLVAATVISAASSESVVGFVITVLVGTAALLFTSGNIGTAWTYVQENPIDIVKWFLFYVGVGVLYAVVRMYFYLRNLRRMLLDFRAGHPDYRDNKKPLDETAMESFKRKADLQYRSFPPRIGEHKSKITRWMVMWPLCWVELRILTNFFGFVYDSIAGGLQSMSDRMFKGLA